MNLEESSPSKLFLNNALGSAIFPMEDPSSAVSWRIQSAQDRYNRVPRKKTNAHDSEKTAAGVQTLQSMSSLRLAKYQSSPSAELRGSDLSPLHLQGALRANTKFSEKTQQQQTSAGLLQLKLNRMKTLNEDDEEIKGGASKKEKPPKTFKGEDHYKHYHLVHRKQFSSNSLSFSESEKDGSPKPSSVSLRRFNTRLT